MKIAYLTSMYPDVSHTFIMREVAELRSQGVDVTTFSVRRPATRNVLGDAARQEASATRWLVPPTGLLLWALARVWLTRPVRSAGVLMDAVFGRGMRFGSRAKWLCYFVEATLLAYWLETESFDHLHCHFGNSGSSTGMLAAQLAGISFSLTVHGSELHEIEKHRLREKVARAAFVACVSKYGRSQLMLACRPEDWTKLQIVRCGVAEVTDMAPRKREGAAHLLCVARLSREKGHLVLLDALARLRAKLVAFRCTLVGDGPMRLAIEAKAAELDLADFVAFEGSLPPDRVAAMYDTADVVALASFSEGVPVVLMEAMAHGRPVVATWVGGVPELVRHGESGLIVSPGDAEELAGALAAVIEDEELAAKYGVNGARYVRESFHVAASAHQLMDLFRQAVAPRAEAAQVPVAKASDAYTC